MKITSQEIRDELSAIWPDLEYIWLFDTTFWKGTIEQVERLMDRSKVKTMDFIPEFNDCDDFAFQFMDEVHRIRYMSWKEGTLNPEQKFPFALFFTAGTSFRGIDKVHAVNLAMLQEGNYLIDMTPGEQRMWEVNPEKDQIYFIVG